jgi:hypothetical protein
MTCFAGDINFSEANSINLNSELVVNPTLDGGFITITSDYSVVKLNKDFRQEWKMSSDSWNIYYTDAFEISDNIYILL